MERLRKNIKLFLAFALPMYVMLLVNSMMNMHVHVFSNGMVFRHAHPINHDNNGDKSHQHTKAEFSFYEGFVLDFFDNSTPLTGLAVNLPLLGKIGETQSADYTLYQFNFAQLRAPPCS